MEVAALIETDPVLSAQVVQSANSAAFNRIQQVESVRHAIVMVGVGTVRRFALVRTIANLFLRRTPAPLFSMTRFNLHSVAVAAMMELLAGEVPLEDPEGAFLAGLFHDVGALLIAVTMPAEYEGVQSAAAVSQQPVVDCEKEILGIDHAELSALALERWGVAETLQQAAADHHEARDAAELPAAEGCVRLSDAIRQADALVDALGMSIEPPRATDQPAPSLQFPGYSLNQAALLERFAEEWKTVDVMLR